MRYMTNSVSDFPIQRIDNDSYVIPSEGTGEVHSFNHSENRADNIDNVRQSLKHLRDLINANTEHPKRVLWVTLTYAENVTDPKRLYKEFHSFWLRFKRFSAKNFNTVPEYIAAVEPQARGAFHLHCLIIFKKKAPFIPNDELKRIWGHGFVSIKAVKSVDNLGVYLNAYLTDMDAAEAISTSHTPYSADRLKEIPTTDPNGKKVSKAVIKGSRLKLYPPNFRIYRCSKGIKRPTIEKMSYGEAMNRIGNAPKTYAKTVNILDDSGAPINTITYLTYNKKAKPKEKNV